MLAVFQTLSCCLFRSEVLNSLASLIVVLHIVNIALVVHPSESVRGVAIHVTITVRCSTIAEKNGNLVESLRRIAPKIECHVGVFRIVGRVTFLAVDEVWELHWIFYEKDWGVVSNHVVIALFSVMLYSKTTWVTITIICSSLTSNS